MTGRGKRLVIAEKPSMARTIAEHLGCRERSEGYVEGKGWVVTWCYGHLVELVPPNGYSGSGWDGKWSLEQLPMMPDTFLWEVRDSAARQFECIRSLCERADVTEIVHACDPDREGEGICRRVLRQIGTDKPVMRLWANSLEDGALRKAFADMRPDADYDGLGDAAEGRALADWLVGMNLSRALTVIYNSRMSTGRVMTPTLHLVCDRTKAHKNFKSVPFWQVVVTCDFGLKLKTEAYATKEDAEEAAAAMRLGKLTVVKADRSTARRRPPALYDLTSLQKDANAAFGLSAQKTLDVVQELYERRLMTYPRTDSRHVTSDDVDDVTELLESADLADFCGLDGKVEADVSRVVNDDKVSGHTALLPTRMLDRKAISSLSDDERAIAALVCCRLFEAVAGDGVDEKCALECVISRITVKGTATHESVVGWRAVRRGCAEIAGGEREADIVVPESVVPGSEVAYDAIDVTEGKTRPPALYTDSTLLAAMEHADKLVVDKQLKEALRDSESHSGGLGTPATRAATIEKLVALGYIERKRKAYVATPAGIAVDSVEPPSIRNVALTAQLEQRLSEVENGSCDLERFLATVREFVETTLAEARENVNEEVAKQVRSGGSVGTCPVCGKPLRLSRNKDTCYCSSRKYKKEDDGTYAVASEGCGFRFSRVICGKRLTDRQLQTLLTKRRVHVGGLTARSGNKFEADVVLNDKGPYYTSLEFGGNTGSGKRRTGRGKRQGRR